MLKVFNNLSLAKRTLALTVAAVIAVSTFVSLPLTVSADVNYKHKAKIYSGDFAGGDDLGNWIVTSSSNTKVESGVLSLSAAKNDESYASAIVRPDTEKYLNQQIRVNYKCLVEPCKTSPTVWLRASLREEGKAESLVGYYAKPGVSGSVNKYEIWKRYCNAGCKGRQRL